MRTARIYKPAKSAMQSGKGNTKHWVLEYPSLDKKVDEIVGWVGSSDMYSQEVRLTFSTKEEAIRYAQENGIVYEITERKKHAPKVRPYSHNYA